MDKKQILENVQKLGHLHNAIHSTWAKVKAGADPRVEKLVQETIEKIRNLQYDIEAGE